MLMPLLYTINASATPLTLHGAGSLKAALTDVTTSYEKTYKTPVTTKFAPSGLLRKAIEEGEQSDVFASANMGHPEKLAAVGWGSPVVLFARNQLCALSQPGLEVAPNNLLSKLVDKRIRVGISTPKADPSGDYAWELFQKAETIEKGSFTILAKKALLLTGGPTSEPAPQDQNQYAWVMSQNKADIFLTYCTNAVLAKQQINTLQIVTIPEALSVGADYGLIVKDGANSSAWQLAMYILSPQGQSILKKYGFEAAAIPKS